MIVLVKKPASFYSRFHFEKASTLIPKTVAVALMQVLENILIKLIQEDLDQAKKQMQIEWRIITFKCYVYRFALLFWIYSLKSKSRDNTKLNSFPNSTIIICMDTKEIFRLYKQTASQFIILTVKGIGTYS